MLLPSTRLIAQAATARGWKVEPLDERFVSTLALTSPQGRTYYFDSCQPPLTSGAAMVIADNKLATYLIAGTLGLPIANFEMYDANTAADFLARNHDIVVKPIDTNHGDGITVGITTPEALEEAVAFAKGFSSKILLQARHSGEDCRVIVVDGQVVAATHRITAHVVGDGIHTVAELIDRKNNDPDRAKRHADSLSVIDLDSVVRYLGEHRLAEVLPVGKKLDVLGTSNIGMGGEAQDMTDTVHPTFKDAAVRIATALDMFLCGVDFLAVDLTKPLTQANGILLEINATPGLRMHQHPAHGTPRDVAGAIMDAFVAKIAGTKS